MEKVKVVLAKSLIGAKPKQKATAKSLGLNKIGDCIVLINDASTAGKVKVLSHLVKIENV
ncbi:MAG: 50S ribosomal protein L30 [Clostridia bacterium]|nr:50S ribosomal protein L30 [Clostridia bacterium]